MTSRCVDIPRMSRSSIYGLFATAALATGCATADIRPDVLQNNATASLTNEDGRVWLERAVAAQGGLDALKAAGTVSMVLVDDWPGWFIRMVGSPWAHNPQTLKLDAKLGTDDARITMLDGPDEGQAWGIQNWVTYRVDASGKVTMSSAEDPDEDIKFWVPTVLYFPFLSFRILEADVVEYAGDEVIDGRGYAKVYATWGSKEPQDTVDQYVLWIDRDTRLVRWAQYTVRDFAGWMVSMMRYDDYRSVGPIKLPFAITGVEDLEDEGPDRHMFRVQSAEVGVTFPKGHLYPEPSLRGKK